MQILQTPHGELPAQAVHFDTQEKPVMAVVSTPCSLTTSAGKLTPQHSTDDLRRPRVEPLLFHPSGNLKSLPLEERTPVDTPLGKLPAELVTFYEDGSLRRVFPLNGKLSGYWSWQDEGKRNVPVTLATPAGSITAMLISVQFYPGGQLRSITLWPGQQVTVQSPLGPVPVRVGMAFYKDGALRSLEPAEPMLLDTPVGQLEAFDSDPEGLTGDVNSLRFTPGGQLAGLATVTYGLSVNCNGQTREYEPRYSVNLCDEEEKSILPLRVDFENGQVHCQAANQGTHQLSACGFAAKRLHPTAVAIAYSCGEGGPPPAAGGILASMPGK